MKFRWTYLVLILLGASLSSFAQVSPPTIDCVKNDSILYNFVSNSCGAFISYEIFTSPNPNGPFTSLGIVSDPSVDFFIHPNSASQVAYYYIRPDFDCPGEPVINSDTISNRPPEVGLLHTVSVENNLLTLRWDLSPSPEATIYSVFLFTDTGIDFIADTPDNFYIDPLRDPDVSTHQYLIVAIDNCGNRSIFGDPVSSVFLTNTIVPCEEGITFNWNRHQNAERQELWLVATDGTETLLEDLPTDAESFELLDIPNVDIESFFIRGYIDGNQDRIADSNRLLTENNIVVRMDEIFFTDLNTLNNNNLEIAWCWNEQADLAESRILYVTDAVNDFSDVPLTGPLQSSNSDNIAFIAGLPQLYTIELETTDVCDGVFTSPQIQSILLEVNPISASEFEINWSAFEYPDASLENYQLFESSNGNNELIYEGFATSQILTRAGITGETCYFVTANAIGFLNDGTEKATRITSNLGCSSGLPIIRLPNAFNPYGINSIFRPLVGNERAILNYQMKIFSRYGELIYNTDDWNQGWNGRSGLREMPQGAYPYLVEVEVMGGDDIVIKGSVLLVR